MTISSVLKCWFGGCGQDGLSGHLEDFLSRRVKEGLPVSVTIFEICAQTSKYGLESSF